MPARTNPLVRLFLVVALAAVTALIVLAGWQDRTPIPNTPQEKEARQRAREARMMRDLNALPEAAYEAVETDPVLRRAKNKRYNAGTKPFQDLADNTEKTKLYCSWGASETEAFPADESHLIVIGTVTDAKGFVSEDKSAAYSEYTLHVSAVMNGAEKLAVNQITIEREGAKVVLANGKRYRYWVMKQGTPQVGQRYLFFLKETPEGKDYFVLTGYELSNGRVSPLDGITGKYQFFDGVEETTFIEIVRSSLK
jgi:hypothetical protein